jgi:hypothetical protein
MNKTTTANRSAAEATVRHLYGRLMDGWNRAGLPNAFARLEQAVKERVSR